MVALMIVLLAASAARAADPVQAIYDTCMQDTRWEFCAFIKDSKDTMEKRVNIFVENNGMQTFSTMLMTIMSSMYQKKLVVQESYDHILFSDRQILEASPDEVRLIMLWTFN
jgi:hypothetical protein